MRSAVVIAAGSIAMACTADPPAHRAPGPPSAANKTDGDDCVDSFPPDILPVADIDDMMMVERIFMEDALPEKLSETPLYADIGAKTVHPALRHYTPEYQLWSDGADKERWVYVPECSSVDTSDMDNWDVPVGTRFFKEFSLDGKRIETRIISRISDGPRDFAYASYLWNASETEATRVDSSYCVCAPPSVTRSKSSTTPISMIRKNQNSFSSAA